MARASGDAHEAQPLTAQPSDEPGKEDNLAATVERYLTRYFAGFDSELPPPGLYHRILREIEYPLLSAALAATRGNQIRAAALLGLNRNTLRKKLADLGLDKAKKKKARLGREDRALDGD